MKKMTCRQLGGACDFEFCAETFEEIAELSQKHGMDMYKEGEPEHLKAMEQMNQVMQSPNGMKEWMNQKRKEFEAQHEEYADK